MSPLILFLVKLATASKTVADATGTYENAAQKGIEKELVLWFRQNVAGLKLLAGDSDKLTIDEIAIGTNHGKVECVKAYKNRTGKSLIDSKNFVEQYFEQNGLSFCPNSFFQGVK